MEGKEKNIKFCCDCAYYNDSGETEFCTKHLCDTYEVTKNDEDGYACKDWAIGIKHRMDWQDIRKLFDIAEQLKQQYTTEEIEKMGEQTFYEEIIRQFK